MLSGMSMSISGSDGGGAFAGAGAEGAIEVFWGEVATLVAFLIAPSVAGGLTFVEPPRALVGGLTPLEFDRARSCAERFVGMIAVCWRTSQSSWPRPAGK